MTITVQQLIEKLQGFPADSVILINDVDGEQEFFIKRFIPKSREKALYIVIDDEEEPEEEESGGEG